MLVMILNFIHMYVINPGLGGVQYKANHHKTFEDSCQSASAKHFLEMFVYFFSSI